MAQASLPAIEVLYEDNHVIVVVKPVNVPTQEDDSRDPDLLTMIKQDLKHRHRKPGNVYLGLVHRLDRPVGGVMVFAKTSKAASRLSDAVRTRSIRKIYTAVVNGRPQEPHGTLKHYLLKDTKTNMVSVAVPGKPGAKEAVLDYQVLDHSEGLSLVQVELHTGRPHQIRVQFAAIGCPLVGDQRYGAHLTKPGQQIALWSTELSFEHPTTKETLSFRSAPPASYPWFLWSEKLQ
ncbi:RNA pseudouridine synthase [Paenibacillus doosanensis]|uniref:RNA pseudouridylate synthase n=1 Tax=Paenibacillus konkukensis TaxID=2020716 RepID=A0ABY4RI58_9BACL|nr:MULTISPECIES: RNA pseudouridine synthase [Paenibacillus]MCS7459727.1 RNA pseudouridine synthase [Paenibacillus doosanensis]UQZ81857.1 Ribosomal large subunit pseudouridine synthase D [Paenibacillus konkukensis]